MRLKMIRNKVLEGVLLFLLFIYIGKVLLVMLYLDPGPNKNGGVVQEDPALDRNVRDGYGVLRRFNQRTPEPVAIPKGTDYDDSIEGGYPHDALNSELFREVLQPVYNHAHQCQNNDVFLVALIGSSPGAFDTRMAIRETWANVPDAEAHGVKTLFVLGLPPRNKREDAENIQSSVFQENERYDDILQGNFVDTFRNSTLKYLMGLKWATNRCTCAKFAFYGDENLFVNYKKIVKQMRGLKSGYDKNLWLGKIVKRSRAVRDKNSRYFVSQEQFQGENYPPFCTGDAGFVLSMNAVKEQYLASLNQTLIPFPDAYTGVIARQYQFTIVNDEAFTYKNFRGDACNLRNVITSRGMNTESLYHSWQNFENTTFLRDCPSPDLDLVLMNRNASNKEYLDRTLRLLYDHPGACYDDYGQPENVFMLVLISSLPRHFEAREAIRKTWGGQSSVSGETLKLLFIMGLSQKDTVEIQQKVLEEDKMYGDIIQARFTESFQNLTLKVIMGLKWVTEHCSHATYVYKGDDDMFVNFFNIIRYVKNLRAKGDMLQRSILGSVMYRSVRVRRKESKYYVPDDIYRGRYFPPYCSGGGYIMTTDVIPDMYQHSLTTPFIPIDDAYQGILADKVSAKALYHTGFKNWGEKSDTCSLHNPEIMTIHGFKKQELMIEVWRNYTDTSVVCSSTKPS